MVKLLFLGPGELNRLIRDLEGSASLSSPNAMLGFVRTLDGDNQWSRAPKLAFAADEAVFRKLFMCHTGMDDQLCSEMSTAEQNGSKGRRKTGPFSVMRYAVLRVVPLVHRRAPRCFA